MALSTSRASTCAAARARPRAGRYGRTGRAHPGMRGLAEHDRLKVRECESRRHHDRRRCGRGHPCIDRHDGSAAAVAAAAEAEAEASRVRLGAPCLAAGICAAVHASYALHGHIRLARLAVPWTACSLFVPSYSCTPCSLQGNMGCMGYRDTPPPSASSLPPPVVFVSGLMGSNLFATVNKKEVQGAGIQGTGRQEDRNTRGQGLRGHMGFMGALTHGHRNNMVTCLHTYVVTCLHTYVVTCLHTYMVTCPHTYMGTCLHTTWVWLHAYMPTHLHTYMGMATHLYAYTPTWEWLHTYMPAHLHGNGYTPTCLHTYMGMATRLHAYTPTWVWLHAYMPPCTHAYMLHGDRGSVVRTSFAIASGVVSCSLPWMECCPMCHAL